MRRVDYILPPGVMQNIKARLGSAKKTVESWAVGASAKILILPEEARQQTSPDSRCTFHLTNVQRIDGFHVGEVEGDGACRAVASESGCARPAGVDGSGIAVLVREREPERRLRRSKL